MTGLRYRLYKVQLLSVNEGKQKLLLNICQLAGTVYSLLKQYTRKIRGRLGLERKFLTQLRDFYVRKTILRQECFQCVLAF